jgi:protoporphyrinogen oxidase
MCATRQVCIIGGGFTGLAAATDLLQSGAGVHLVERRDRLGGMAGGFREPGWLSSLEYTYHHFFATDRTFREYAEKWDMADQLILRRPVTSIETAKSGFVRMDSPASLLKYPDISPLNRVRLGAALAYLRTTGQWKQLERITAETWCRRWMGNEAYEALWKPQLVSKFGAEWEPKISMAFLWARLHARSPELGTIQGGFQAMADRAEEHLVKQGATVSRGIADAHLQPEDGGSWRVRINGAWHIFDAVIVAAQPQTLQTVTSTLDREFCERICSQPYLGSRTIILSLNRPLGRSYWYSLHPRNDSSFTVAVEHTNFVPAELFAGEHIVYFSTYLSPDSDEWNRDDATLRSKALECATRINPEITDDNINRSWVFDYAYAQPIRCVNASSTLPPVAISGCKGLFHASMAHIYPWDRGTNFALDLGGKVAALCLNYLRSL